MIGTSLCAGGQLGKLLHILEAEVALLTFCAAVQALLLHHNHEDLASEDDEPAHHQDEVGHEEFVMPLDLTFGHGLRLPLRAPLQSVEVIFVESFRAVHQFVSQLIPEYEGRVMNLVLLD